MYRNVQATARFKLALAGITVNQSSAQTRTIEADLETKPQRTFSSCMYSTRTFLIQTDTLLK